MRNLKHLHIKSKSWVAYRIYVEAEVRQGFWGHEFFSPSEFHNNADYFGFKWSQNPQPRSSFSHMKFTFKIFAKIFVMVKFVFAKIDIVCPFRRKDVGDQGFWWSSKLSENLASHINIFLEEFRISNFEFPLNSLHFSCYFLDNKSFVDHKQVNK